MSFPLFIDNKILTEIDRFTVVEETPDVPELVITHLDVTQSTDVTGLVTLSIETEGGDSPVFHIDWGDGTEPEFSALQTVNHTYRIGTFQIAVTAICGGRIATAQTMVIIVVGELRSGDVFVRATNLAVVPTSTIKTKGALV